MTGYFIARLRMKRRIKTSEKLRSQIVATFTFQS